MIPAKQKEFEKAIRTPEIFDLNDYGTILYSGWGEPPESVKAEMREKYGMYEG